MVLLTMTPAMVQALEYVQKYDEEQEDEDGIQEPPLGDLSIGKPISHGQVINLAAEVKRLKSSTHDANTSDAPIHSLDGLLRGSRIFVEPPKPRTEQSPAYKALMARLRQEEEARAYERMVNPLRSTETFAQRFPNSQHAHLFPTTQEDIGDSDNVSYDDINRQMALIANVIISIVACSVAIWLAARHWSTPSRLGLSMGGSGMIGIAEVVVYAGYLKRVKDAKAKAKKEVEVKEIVETWVVGGQDEKESKETLLIDSNPSGENDVRRRKKKE